MPSGEEQQPARRRSRLMRVLPFVLLGVGVLALVEGVLTVVWREPLTAFIAAQTQGDLSDDLKDLRAEGRADSLSFAAAESEELSRAQITRRAINKRAIKLDRSTDEGEPLGELRIDALGLDLVVVQGTSDEPLTKGPGHYTETPLPGARGDWTVGIAGHRTTWGAPFRDIDKLEEGDKLSLRLPYGRFRYEVEETEIVDADDLGVFRPKKYDRLSLSACHPLYSDAQRIIVHSRLVDRKPLGGVVPPREPLPEPGLALSAIAVDAPPPVADLRPRVRGGARRIEDVTAKLSNGPPVGEPVVASQWEWKPGSDTQSVALAEPPNPLAPPLVFLYLAGFSAALVSVGASFYGLRRGEAARGGLVASLLCSALVIAGLVLALLGYI